MSINISHILFLFIYLMIDIQFITIGQILVYLLVKSLTNKQGKRLIKIDLIFWCFFNKHIKKYKF